MRSITLWIRVDDQNFSVTLGREIGGQVAKERRFPYAAFVVEKCDGYHARTEPPAVGIRMVDASVVSVWDQEDAAEATGTRYCTVWADEGVGG